MPKLMKRGMGVGGPEARRRVGVRKDRNRAMHHLEKAIAIALEAHTGQKDKGGHSYILHPLRVMMQMETEEGRIAGVLHDVVEDSDMTPEGLLDAGVASEVVAAVEVLTKREGEAYTDFIGRVGKNPLATLVKIADLRDNSDLSRIPDPSEKDRERVEKYALALRALGVASTP